MLRYRPLRCLPAAIILSIGGLCGACSPTEDARSTHAPESASPSPLWVEIPFEWSAADRPPWQSRVIEALREAADAVDRIYLRQVFEDGPDMLADLRSRDDAKGVVLQRLFERNGGPWDRMNDARPFMPGVGARPPGISLYPSDLRKSEIEQYLEDHPTQRGEILSHFTVVRRDGDRLAAIPYHQAYEDDIAAVVKALRRAAGLSEHEGLSQWLSLKADALLTDEYAATDAAWVQLGIAPIEIIIGPYEVYEDELWGVKAMYEMIVGLVDEAVTQRLADYAEQAGAIDALLPYARRHDQVEVMSTFVAMHDVLRSGQGLRSGYTFVATNLPNDPAVQTEFGTRKIFSVSAINARVNEIIRPVAERVLDEMQVPMVTGEGYLHGTALHELAHALGPRTVEHQGREISLAEALRERYSPIEECKATVAGFLGIPHLVEQGLITEDLATRIYVTELAGIFRDMRLGEAHAEASTMELVWHLERGAVVVNDDGRFRAVVSKWPESLRSLAEELLAIESTGDYERAGRFIERYAHFTPEIRAALEKVRDIPREIWPVFVQADP